MGREHAWAVAHLFLARMLLAVATAELRGAADILDVERIWARGINGSGVRVAVIDSGLPRRHHAFAHAAETVDLTNETDTHTWNIDGAGHGTAMAGIIASTDSECRGMAPGAHIYPVRVVSYNRMITGERLDRALEHAVTVGAHVINLSIAASDVRERPLRRIREAVLRSVVVVAAGNFGVVAYPAWEPGVISVGWALEPGQRIQLEKWYNRPDYFFFAPPPSMVRSKLSLARVHIATRASSISAPLPRKFCIPHSGTSAAAAIVSGVVALMLHAAPQLRINPVAVAQVLMQTAKRVPHDTIDDQGSGEIRPQSAIRAARRHQPHLSAFPSAVDFTDWEYFGFIPLGTPIWKAEVSVLDSRGNLHQQQNRPWSGVFFTFRPYGQDAIGTVRFVGLHGLTPGHAVMVLSFERTASSYRQQTVTGTVEICVVRGNRAACEEPLVIPVRFEVAKDMCAADEDDEMWLWW